MRFIKIVESKEHPVKNNKKVLSPNKKISGIKKELKEGLLYLYLIGSNIENNFRYEWNIKFDEYEITSSSIGPILILNKSNTEKYMDSVKVEAIITVNKYISPIIEL